MLFGSNSFNAFGLMNVILFGANVRTSSQGGSVSGSMEEAREGVRIIGVCHNGGRQSALQRITVN